MQKTSISTYIKTLLTCLAILFFISIPNTKASSTKLPINSNEINISAKSALAVDTSSRQILYDKNGNESLPIASVSKLITASIVLDKIQQHELSWDTKVKIGPAIAKLSENSEYTNVPLKSGSSYTVKQLFDASLICSANAAAMALGNHIAGSSNQFGIMMQNYAKKLDINDAQLYNACGLTNKLLGDGLTNKSIAPDAENKMSAVGIAKIAQKLVHDNPIILQTTKEKNLNWENKPYHNTNELLGKSEPFFVDGLKSGTSDSAGENFVGTATKNGHRIITVIMGAEKGQRFPQTELMLKAINNKLQPNSIANQTKKIRVYNGQQKTSEVKPMADQTFWLPKQEKIKTMITANKKQSWIMAPIKANQSYGKLTVSSNGNDLYFLPGTKTQMTMIYARSNPISYEKLALEILLVILIIGLSYLGIKRFKH